MTGSLESFLLLFVALTIWTYILTKLFVFDVDIYIFRNFAPGYDWLLYYRSLFFFGALGLFFLLVRRTTALYLLLYLIFFPILLMFWNIPVFIYRRKSYVLALSYLDMIFHFVREFKYRIVVGSAYLVFSGVSLSFHQTWVLWLSIAGLSTTLMSSYLKRLISIVRPSSLVDVYSKILGRISEHLSSTAKRDESLAALAVAEYDEKQLTQYANGLGALVVYNRACSFFARKLRDYQTSSVFIINNIFIFCMLFVTTWLTFSAMNYALFKIDPGSFLASPEHPRFFTFVYYSFKAMLFSSITGLQPASNITRAFEVAQNLFAILSGAVFLALIVPARNERSVRELNYVVKNFEEAGRMMELTIKQT